MENVLQIINDLGIKDIRFDKQGSKLKINVNINPLRTLIPD